MKAIALVSTLFLFATPAQARELGGVDVPEKFNVEGQDLLLNGAGIRSKFMVKVYVGGLYLTTKSQDADTIIGSDMPKAIRLQFKREVDMKKIRDAWSEGFANNCKENCASFQASLEKLNSNMEDMKEKDTLTFFFSSDKVVLLKNDKKKGEVVQKGFPREILSIFLGKKPADSDLKSGMLDK